MRRRRSVARGFLAYGYFVYPLYTLGAEQLFRVADAAASHKCRQLGVPETKLGRMSFQKRVAHLVRQGVILPTAERGWDALRQLRNLASHPEDHTILLPGTAIDELRCVALGVDNLFREQPALLSSGFLPVLAASPSTSDNADAWKKRITGTGVVGLAGRAESR